MKPLFSDGAAMTELDFQEVIERFDEILDAVERGEIFCVFREGRPVAMLQPYAMRSSAQIDTSARPA
jgi:prevent-host-death family protein